MADDSLKIQVAALECVVAALINQCITSLDDAEKFLANLESSSDEILSSPHGRHAEYSDHERHEIAATMYGYALSIPEAIRKAAQGSTE